MKRVACLIALVISVCVTVVAQRNSDFASRYMETIENDSRVQCETISPKMMEQLTSMPDSTRSEVMQQALQKLKSARIITALDSVEQYYSKAITLLKKYPQRFKLYEEYEKDDAYGAFYSRRSKADRIVELIMLRADIKTRTLIIINLTGDLDEIVISMLSL